jgi:hypothetical protein
MKSLGVSLRKGATGALAGVSCKQAVLPGDRVVPDL